MSKSNIERNIKQIQQTLKSNLNYIDINYKGVDKYGFILQGGSAVINQYKIWLQSSGTDYHRQPGKAGFFDGQLNRYKFSPESEESIKTDLINETTTQFPNLEVIGLDIICMMKERKWSIKVAVKDKITGIIGIDDTGLNISVPV